MLTHAIKSCFSKFHNVLLKSTLHSTILLTPAFFFFLITKCNMSLGCNKKYLLVVRPHEGLPLPLWVNCWVTEETQSAGATYTLPDIKLNIDQVRKIRSKVSLWCPSRAVSALNESLDTHTRTHITQPSVTLIFRLKLELFLVDLHPVTRFNRNSQFVMFVKFVYLLSANCICWNFTHIGIIPGDEKWV